VPPGPSNLKGKEMAVTLLRSYQGYASGAVVAFSFDTESSLIAQGLAVAATGVPTQSNTNIPTTGLGEFTIGGNVVIDETGSGLAAPLVAQGPRILPNGTILAFAGLGTDTTVVTGTLYRCEIFVPFKAEWTGIGVLNGATVTGDLAIVALYDSNGVRITNSAVAGTVSAGANAFQQRAFVNKVVLQPGRYFLAYQGNAGGAVTIRTWAAANGGNQMTSSATGTFGTLPASFTPPTTFTTAVGPIAHLYQ
jgi:hypothetical protein